MKQYRMGQICFLLTIVVFSPQLVEASPREEMDAAAIISELRKLQDKVQSLQSTVEKQQNEIDELKSENDSLKAASREQAEAAQQLASVRSEKGLNALNPEIAVLADIVGKTTESSEDAEGNDKISVRELELVFGRDIDPYSRMDATINLSDFEDVVIEEAYVSHWGIPYVNAKLGRLRPKLGFATSVHRHRLETVDEPLVVQRYLGVEGLFKTGLELSNFIPVPWESVSHEILAGVLEGGIGEEGELLGETRRRPSFYSSLRNFWEISDSTNLTFNGTWLTGSADEDSSYEVNLFGAHAKLVHNFNAIHRVRLQGEAYFQDRDEPALENEEEEHGHERVILREEELNNGSEESKRLNENPFGYYLLADYRFSPNWQSGFRFDYVEPTNRIDGDVKEDMAFSGYLTLRQSEFARWRAQYQHVDLAEGGDDNRFWLQGTFAIGVHKHPID